MSHDLSRQVSALLQQRFRFDETLTEKRVLASGADRVYASGFNDSGLYVGACRDCEATISHALAERNAYGYAGTNAGGHLVAHSPQRKRESTDG